MEAVPIKSTTLNWESRGYDEQDLDIAQQLFSGACNYSSYTQHAKYHQEALIMSLFLPNSLIQFGTNWYRMIPLGSNKHPDTPPPTSSVLAPDNIGLLLMSSVFLELGQQVNELNSQNPDPVSTWSTLPSSPPPINLVAAFRPNYISNVELSQSVSNPDNNQGFFSKVTLPSGATQYSSKSNVFSHQPLRNHGSQAHAKKPINAGRTLHSIATTPGSQTIPGGNFDNLARRFESGQAGEHGSSFGQMTGSGIKKFRNIPYSPIYPPSSGELPLTPMTSNKVSLPHSNSTGMTAVNNSKNSQHTPPPSASNSKSGAELKVFRKLSLNPQTIPGSALSSRTIASQRGSQRRSSHFFSHSSHFRPYSTERPNSPRGPTPSGLAVSIQPNPQHFKEKPCITDLKNDGGNDSPVLETNDMVIYQNHLAEIASDLGNLIKSDESTSTSLIHTSLENSKRLSRKFAPNSKILQFTTMGSPWYTIESRDFPLGISGTLVDENEKSFWDPIVEPIASSLRSYFVATVLKIFKAQRKPGKPLDVKLGLGSGDGVGITEDIFVEDDEFKLKSEPTENKHPLSENPNLSNVPSTSELTLTVSNSSIDPSKRTPATIADKLMELVAEFCTQNFAALDRDAKTLLNQALWCLGAYQLGLCQTALKRFRSNYPGPTTKQLKRTHLKHCFYYARLFAHMWGGQVPISRLSNFDISPISVIKVLSASACYQVRRALDELDSRF